MSDRFGIEKKYLKEIISLLKEKIKENEDKTFEKKDENNGVLSYVSNNSLESAEINLLKEDLDLSRKTINKLNNLIEKYKKMLPTPYFVCLIIKDEEGLHEYYIGYANLLDSEGIIKIYDWKSPIGDLLYKHNDIPVKTELKDNEIEIVGKRQFIILEGKLINVFDNNESITDEILRKILNENAEPTMKNIIRTIQKKQNNLIRFDYKNMLIEGAAGTGKTSVAMHRIAYLLYESKERESKEQNILIFSPNDTFYHFIKDILPSIGSNNVPICTFDLLCKCFIDEFKLVSNNTELTENILSENYKSSTSYYDSNSKANKEFEKKVIKFKKSEDFIEIVDRYIDYIEENLPFEDIYFNQHFFITKEEILEYKADLYELPLQDQLDRLYEKIEYWLQMRIPSRKFNKEILEELKPKLQLNVRQLYKDFFLNKHRLFELCNKNQEQFEILNKSNISVVNGVLRPEDVIPYLYFKSCIKGISGNDRVSHVVIDEIQDYTYTELLVIQEIFKNATFTLIGDKNQSIIAKNDLCYIKKAFPDIYLTKLIKSYRSTSQINKFVNKLTGIEVDHINRSGEEVEIRKCKESEIVNDIIEEAFTNEQKYNTIAIITKTEEQIYNIKRNLAKSKYSSETIKRINIITDKNVGIKNGINIISAARAKGLEFDSVICYEANENNYSQDNRNLLYLICSRALHKLSIYYTNKLTSILE